MSLATRCTACGTVFRVVQDQLKVSEGWVRCGRCSEVFNALQALFDLERDAPADWPSSVSGEAAEPPPSAPPLPTSEVDEPPPEAALPRASEPVDPPASVEAPEPTQPIDAAVTHHDEPAMLPRDAGRHSTPAARVSERDRLEFPDAQFDPDMLPDDTVHLQAPPAELESASVARAHEAADAQEAPDFIRHAQQRARWQSPAMRALQAAVALLLISVLVLQGAHHFRDTIAVRWPATAPALATWCRAVACQLGAPSRIEDVSVESTALTRASAPDAFKLAVVLRNRGATVVALPSIDLTLTDNGGQLVSRRVLSPRDFRVASTVIKPGGESALQLLLNAGSARVTGYTIEVFYP